METSLKQKSYLFYYGTRTVTLFTNISPFLHTEKVNIDHLKTVCLCVYGSGDPKDEE